THRLARPLDVRVAPVHRDDPPRGGQGDGKRLLLRLGGLLGLSSRLFLVASDAFRLRLRRFRLRGPERPAEEDGGDGGRGRGDDGEDQAGAGAAARGEDGRRRDDGGRGAAQGGAGAAAGGGPGGG